MFIEYNPNPVGNNVGDCVIRAITKAMDKTWEDTTNGGDRQELRQKVMEIMNKYK